MRVPKAQKTSRVKEPIHEGERCKSGCARKNAVSTYYCGDLDLDSSFKFDPGVPVLSQQKAPTLPENFAGQELIELGLQEALPAQELMDELHHIFFVQFYPVITMIHEYRYYTSLTRAPLARPPICLRYAIWASAASLSDEYKSLEDLLYGRARRYLDASDIKGEVFVTIYHAQTWCLIAMFEAKNARFSQSWMSAGRAVRLVQMLGLYALDAEREDAKQILTNLPVSELSFRFGLVEETNPFTEAFSSGGLGQISPFSALLLATKLYGHNRVHLNINSPNECVEYVENGEFWKRHRRLDNALLNTFLYLPDSLRLPHGINDMNTAFVYMSIHASSINLHQGAIAASMKHGINPDVIRHSQVRTLTAEQEITNIMQQIDNVDVALLNSWTGFCLYVAGGVKDQQSDQIFDQGLRNINHLLSAVQRIGQ
ncbi:transcriptional regulatory protein C530.05-like protein 13 [Botrytis cinerea]